MKHPARSRRSRRSNVPAGVFVHADAPAVEYVPAGHEAPGPVAPLPEMNVPAGVFVHDVAPAVEEYVPADMNCPARPRPAKR